MATFICDGCGMKVSMEELIVQDTVYDDALGPGRVGNYYCSYACYKHLHDGQEGYQQCPACERIILPTLANFPVLNGNQEICARCINEITG